MTSEELESVAKQLIEMEFLSPGEDLSQIILDDNSTVGKLGLTNKDIAERMEYFFKKITDIKGYVGRETVPGLIIDGLNVRGYNADEFVLCPLHKTAIPYGSFGITVTNTGLNEGVNYVNYSGVNVHLIGYHNFYGGGKNRKEPPLLARVLIKPVIRQL